MNYSIKEIYYTLQGEGAHTGRSSVFLRFTGCNLWTGREEDRPSAICSFCDTHFLGVDGANGGIFESADTLARCVEDCWPARADGIRRYVVCTGGEPLLQLDAPLIDALHHRSFTIAIETNGTRHVPDGVDWVCVSPKANAECVVLKGDELKLVYPQVGGEPERYEQLNFGRFFLQPMDGPHLERNRQMAVEYCLAHPQWELSVQMHKVVGIR